MYNIIYTYIYIYIFIYIWQCQCDGSSIAYNGMGLFPMQCLKLTVNSARPQSWDHVEITLSNIFFVSAKLTNRSDFIYGKLLRFPLIHLNLGQGIIGSLV